MGKGITESPNIDGGKIDGCHFTNKIFDGYFDNPL